MVAAILFSRACPAHGAESSRAPAVTLKAIEVVPKQATLQGPRASQQLIVLGTFTDGSVRDVTDGATFVASTPSVARISSGGFVTSVADGNARITAAVGAIAADAGIVVRDIKADGIYFINDIQPILAGCNRTGCHGSPKGKNGFQLSLFGAEPRADYDMVTNLAMGRRVNRVEPARSHFLLKATAAVSHGGGKTLEPGSADYNLMVQWVARGLPWGDEQAPKLVGIEVEPAELALNKDDHRQLLVTARFSYGSSRDVTRYASYTSNDEPVVTVARGGRAVAQLVGEAIVIVGYGGQFATSRIAVPQKLPLPFPVLPTHGKIDELVFAKLKRLGLPPSPICSDAEFIRRASLDLIGTLPTTIETTTFLADKDPGKRAKLIDRLLERPEYADYWAMKWGDLLRVKPEFPIQLWPKGATTFHRWIRESLAENKPYDQFVRELLTSTGSGYRVGPANYFRATSTKDPQSWAEMTATTFLGVRIDCAHCHNHPFEALTWDDSFGLAAFFPLGLKTTGEWGDEIVYHNPARVVRHVRTNEIVKPKLLGGAVLDIPADEDPRGRFVDWMISQDNPWFARNIANRVWYWLLGRGIIHEPDDLRVTNPPENPELLDYLCGTLRERHYDLKHLFRQIMNSTTYQLSSHPNEFNRHDETHFSHYPIKRLGAEQLLDAISAVCESPEKFPGLPTGYRSIQLPHSGVSSFFLDLFGRPPRDISCECERKEENSMPQALYLINTDHLEGKLRNGQRVKRLLKEGKSDSAMIDELYLAALSRQPTHAERTSLLTFVASKKKAREQAIQDVIWTLLNTKEFMFNH
jgi:hypothetical protein